MGAGNGYIIDNLKVGSRPVCELEPLSPTQSLRPDVARTRDCRWRKFRLSPERVEQIDLTMTSSSLSGF